MKQKETPSVAERSTQQVGLEIEFSGLDGAACASLVQAQLGGEVRRHAEYVWFVEHTCIGDCRVEVDARFFNTEQYAELGRAMGIKNPVWLFELGHVAREITRGIVPLELVLPPVSVSQLPLLEKLRAALHEAGASGSGHSLVAAFGLHINAGEVEVSIARVLPILRAFLVLQPKLMQQVDLTRRLLRYAAPFPDEYTKYVLAPDYEPTWHEFVVDYLRYNPVRNRALDLLPIISVRSGKLVREALPEDQAELVSARPAYHFRLPDCRLADPDWTLAQEISRWQRVQRLARDPVRLRRVADARIAAIDAGVMTQVKEGFMLDAQESPVR